MDKGSTDLITFSDTRKDNGKLSQGPGEDDLRLAILTNLIQVLFLILILFKTLSFNIIKKD